MRYATRALLACLSLSPAPALAWDWSLDSTISETVSASDNQFMRSMLAGGTLASYTNVTANALARTQTSRLTIDANVGYQKYWGPGTEGINQTESNSLGVNARYETWGKNQQDREWLIGTFSQSSTVVAVLNDLGFATRANGNTERVMVGGGVQRSLSALDTISISATSSLTAFDPASAGTQFTDSTVTGTWRRQISPLTTVSATSQVEWLSYNTTPHSDVIILRNTAGFDTSISRVLSYGGSAGVIYSSSQGGTASQFGPSIFPTTSATGGSTVGFIGDAHAIYRILKNTTLNLMVGQSVSPSVLGTLAKRTTLHAGLDQIINGRSSVSIAGDISRQTTSGTTSDFFSSSITYSYILARDWNASLTYRYLHRTATSGGALVFDPVTGLPIIGGAGPASSNTIMAVLSKHTNIIPLGD